MPAALAPDAEHRHEVVVHPDALRFTGVAPNEDDETHGQEYGPAEDSEETDVERRDDDLRDDDDRDDGDDQPDAGPVVDRSREMLVELPLEGDDHPGQRVDEDGDVKRQT